MTASWQLQAVPEFKRWLDALSDGGGTDAELLERFLARRDPLAVEAILRRHGPMVLGVCRRVLGHGPDADDAFQATFLVLVHKAHAVQPRHALGNWLYGVARRSALKAKSMNHHWHANRRRALTRPTPPPATKPDTDSLAALDEELAALPDTYRSAIVLCELEGKTIKEAARQMGIPQGTVASRLTRGRALLAQRLRARGLTFPAAGLAAMLVPVESTLQAATLQSLRHLAAGQALTAATTVTIASLTQKVINAMLLSKLKIPCGLLLVLACLTSYGVLATTLANAAMEPAVVTEDKPSTPPSGVAAANANAAKTDPGQMLLDGLDRAFCRGLAALVKDERDSGKPVTSHELVREVIKVFPNEENLTQLLNQLEAEKEGKAEASPAVRDLLADFHRRYVQAPGSTEGQMSRELVMAFSTRVATLVQLSGRYGGHDRKQWDAAQQAELTAAIERINEYRQRAGLQTLPVDGTPDLMARRHAVYLDLNREGKQFQGDQGADEQIAGRPGYSYNGQLLAASTLVGFGKPTDVVDGWMATFPGRCALLRPDLADVRIAQVTSAPPGAGYRGPLVVARYGNVKSLLSEQQIAVVFPEDGAKDVPVRLADQRPSLVPSDAPRDSAGRAEAGYPISITFWGSDRIAQATGTLSRSVGEGWETVPAYVSTPDQPALPETWVCNLGSVCLVPRSPLTPETKYRAEFKAEIDGKPFARTSTFTTGKSQPVSGAPMVRYAPAMNNSLNNAFRNRPGLLLGSARSVAIKGDEKYLAALDVAFYRLVLWRARWEQGAGDVLPWRPLLELTKDWSPSRKEISELLGKVDTANRPFPSEGLDMVAEHALRYRDLAKQPDAAQSIRDAAQKRLDVLLAFHRQHGGKNLSELEARTQGMAERGVAALNAYRKRLNLPQVELDPGLSQACRNHAIYIDLNRGEGAQSWVFWGKPTPHEADRTRPGYSEAGAFAGMSSDIAFSTPEHCVQGWMSSFFHRIPLINPEAKQIGIGYTLSADAHATGTGKIALLSVPAITRKSTKQSAVLYPETGATGILRNYGLESPNPIPNPEKKDDRGWPVAGFPATATFFGYESITGASGKLFHKQGEAWVEVPAYFSSPEKPAAYFPDNMKTLCLMAKDWLAPHATYKVEFKATLDGKEWSGETTFQTGGEKALVGEK